MREFWLQPGREAEFARAFGALGLWNRLLSRANGYRGSDLRRKPEGERRYRLRDFWSSHREFEAFREGSSEVVTSFRRFIAIETLVEREEWLGAYYELGAAGDGDDLVPA